MRPTTSPPVTAASRSTSSAPSEPGSYAVHAVCTRRGRRRPSSSPSTLIVGARHRRCRRARSELDPGAGVRGHRHVVRVAGPRTRRCPRWRSPSRVSRSRSRRPPQQPFGETLVGHLHRLRPAPATYEVTATCTYDEVGSRLRHHRDRRPRRTAGRPPGGRRPTSAPAAVDGDLRRPSTVERGRRRPARGLRWIRSMRWIRRMPRRRAGAAQPAGGGAHLHRLTPSRASEMRPATAASGAARPAMSGTRRLRVLIATGLGLALAHPEC